MHIMEGYLPLKHALFWTGVSLPFWVICGRKLIKQIRENPSSKLQLACVGGFAFVLSALKIPSVNGSSSHPTGVGLGAALFGPAAMVVLGTITLIFQALFLAHGGISTLGANAFSMAIVGSFVAYGIHHFLQRIKLSKELALFVAVFVSGMATYSTTATQLALAYPDPIQGFLGAWFKFLGIFAITQIPLSLSEAFLSVLLMRILQKQGVLQ